MDFTARQMRQMRERKIGQMAMRTSTPLLSQYALCLAKADGRPRVAAEIAETSAAPGVARILRAAVGAGDIADPSWASGLVDYSAMVSAFVDVLRTRSVFARMLDAGVVRAPLGTRVSAATASATGFVLGRGAAVPLSSMALSGPALEPQRAAALVIVSEQLIDAGGPRVEAFLSRALRDAVTSVIDAELFSAIVDSGSLSGAASGQSALHALADIKTLLGEVAPTGAETLFFAAAPDVARAASTLASASGVPTFHAMSATGGELAGVPCLVSNQMTAGELMLIDASGLVGNIEAITIQASRDTSIEMVDNPSMHSITPTATSVISLWQTHSVGVMANTYFAIEKFRSNAVAVLTGINWAQAAS